jgi:threonylcarbamoyladenosine tRNA methylthiotransferase MtaB
MLSGTHQSNTFGFSYRSRPYVKVQDGCNSACTYCIIPKARGKSRSVDISDILAQTMELEAQGYREIVLTGIHLGSYGKDSKPKLKLSHLIETLLHKTTIHRIRLSSIEVNEVDDDILGLLKEKRICKHIHVPLQSGDDTVLADMNRKYRSRDYRSVIESIANQVPGVAIGTDVIVGFPGEGEKEFSNTRNLLDALPLAYMHIFPFSPRPGTVASAMTGQVSSPVKKQRWSELNSINLHKKTLYMSSQANRVLDVIVEDNYDDQSVVGTSSNYLRIMVCAEGYPKKSLVYVRIAGIERNMLKGYPIEKL